MSLPDSPDAGTAGCRLPEFAIWGSCRCFWDETEGGPHQDETILSPAGNLPLANRSSSLKTSVQKSAWVRGAATETHPI